MKVVLHRPTADTELSIGSPYAPRKECEHMMKHHHSGKCRRKCHGMDKEKTKRSRTVSDKRKIRNDGCHLICDGEEASSGQAIFKLQCMVVNL